MAFPDAGIRIHLPPKKVAPGTFLIQDIQHALGEPLSVYLNSAVIQGAEPVIVDTGSAKNREQWLQDVFGLVEPEDVRWVFLSHDDVDALDPEVWWGGMVMFGIHALAPWLSMVDGGRYATSVKQVQAHGMTTIISGHSPVIGGPRVQQAFDMMGRLAGAQPPPCPDQAVLEMMLSAMGGE